MVMYEGYIYNVWKLLSEYKFASNLIYSAISEFTLHFM